MNIIFEGEKGYILTLYVIILIIIQFNLEVLILRERYKLFKDYLFGKSLYIATVKCCKCQWNTSIIVYIL